MIRHTLIAVILLACVNTVPALAQSQGPAEAGRYIEQPVPTATGQTTPPAKPATAPPPPAIRRWLDVQQLSMGGRFRWYENSAGRLISSTLQWQPQIRARFLFDQAAKYSVNGFASSGATFPSSWNNTGGGIGLYTHPFNLKQLLAQAEPVKGLEFQAGGLHLNRGENSENLSYATAAYIVGERVAVRPAKGRIAQVSFTAAYFGDYRQPNLFKRFHRLNEWNYGQALVGVRVSPRVNASAEYTYEDRRDILRQAVTIRPPESLKKITSVKVETYQRIAPDRGYGFNTSADLRLTPRLVVTGGVMSVDKNYGPFNGDRYETGNRWYTIGTFTVTRDVTVSWFQTEAFATDFPITLTHRFDLLIAYNPTASLKRAGSV